MSSGSSPSPLVVAIDGPAGSGKSTLARRLAEALGWAYLDTGAMYRAVTVRALEAGIAPTDGVALAKIARDARIDLDPRTGRVCFDGRDVTDAIRTSTVDAAVSDVAAVAAVRDVMVAHQRRFAAVNGQVVAEGRDIGTVVFPEATLKIYLDASAEERARRRLEEKRHRDPTLDPAAVRASLDVRDGKDSRREVAPLREADDAVRVDTTGLGPDKVLEVVRGLVLSRVPPVRP